MPPHDTPFVELVKLLIAQLPELAFILGTIVAAVKVYFKWVDLRISVAKEKSVGAEALNKIDKKVDGCVEKVESIDNKFERFEEKQIKLLMDFWEQFVHKR